MPKRFLNVEYAGTRTRINVTDFERLGQVQDAIKAKLTHALAHVDAPQLQLYDQQRQHIQDLEDVPEDYFKKQRNGGLFLVIRTSPPPSRQASRNDLSESEGPRKRQRTELTELTQRLKAFTDSQVIDGCIQSRELLPYPQDKIKKLYARKCYKDVFDLLLEKVKSGRESFAISGTPGIGKSLFFIYMLHRFMTDTEKTLPLKPNRIVYQYSKDDFILFDMISKRVQVIERLKCAVLVRNQDTLYVIDGRNSEPRLSSCVTLFISSPRSEWYKNFMNQKKAYDWYFPVWTWEELEECRRYCYPNLTSVTLNERYRVYGGVARFVFNDSFSVTSPTFMDQTLVDVDAIKGVRNIGNPTKIFETSHTLLHIIVSEDGLYRFLHVDVASKYVGEQLWQLHAAQMMTNLQEMFGGAPSEISRHLFEIYGHSVFVAGGRTLRCRSLEDGKESEFTLDVLNERIAFQKDALPKAVLPGKYYEPTYDDSFPAVDAFSAQGMFQFTVADQNLIRGVQVLLELCGLYKQPKLFFVVPPHRFEKFKKQPFKAVKGNADVHEVDGLQQYVLELPVV